MVDKTDIGIIYNNILLIKSVEIANAGFGRSIILIKGNFSRRVFMAGCSKEEVGFYYNLLKELNHDIELI